MYPHRERPGSGQIQLAISCKAFSCKVVQTLARSSTAVFLLSLFLVILLLAPSQQNCSSCYQMSVEKKSLQSPVQGSFSFQLKLLCISALLLKHLSVISLRIVFLWHILWKLLQFKEMIASCLLAHLIHPLFP